MNQFKKQLDEFLKDSLAIQKMEMEVQTKSKLFMEKFMGFLKQNGLPENFTLAEMCALAVKKATESPIIMP